MSEPLALVERRLDREVSRTRQDPFCKRQDAFHVEFLELARVTVEPRERELFAQCLGD